MLENNVNRDNFTHPIDNYEQPKMLNRLAAFAFDIALFILLSLIILTIAGVVAGNKGTSYSNASGLISDHIEYSKLAKYEEKNGYVSYSDEDLLTLENNEPLIVNRLYYFYTSYLTGENIQEGYEASLNKDEYIKIDGVEALPKEHYTTKFFNEKILNLASQKDEKIFFKYQTTDGQIDENKIAVLDENYIEEVKSGDTMIKRIKSDTDLMKFFSNTYNDAIKTFYAQKAIKEATNTINLINSLLMLISSIPSFILIFIVLPLTNPFGRSLGKRLLGIGVVTDKGYQVKKWQLLIRSIPILGATIYVCLINSLYYQLLLPLLLLLISTGIVVFNNHRRSLHDLMSGTSVIKLEKKTIVYPDAKTYEQALAIMKQRDEAKNGQE